ncbi:hypothetical protein E2C01_023449 [Portunus trituberculatus]|uniref:Uncharacterized protein n=1 Tax=Portunus trituberculatus TaxID=210409 RepID=A0A5B7E7Z6_PORTR|nr:hypothetical protein [Portunus trituberculatus]
MQRGRVRVARVHCCHTCVFFVAGRIRSPAFPGRGVRGASYARWPQVAHPRVRGQSAGGRAAQGQAAKVVKSPERKNHARLALAAPPALLTHVPAARGGGRGGTTLLERKSEILDGRCLRRGRGRDTCCSAAPQRKWRTNGPGCVHAPRHNKQKPGQKDAAAAHRRRHLWIGVQKGECPLPRQLPPTPSVKPFSGERVWVLMLLGSGGGEDGGTVLGCGVHVLVERGCQRAVEWRPYPVWLPAGGVPWGPEDAPASLSSPHLAAGLALPSSHRVPWATVALPQVTNIVVGVLPPSSPGSRAAAPHSLVSKQLPVVQDDDSCQTCPALPCDA